MATLRMTEERRLAAVEWAKILAGVGIFLACIAFCIFVGWLTLSHQNTKLYESDNVVCASQPLAITCWERKTKP